MSGWRVGVEHVTTYTYSQPVSSSFNEARLTPRADDRQTVLASAVRTDPPTRAWTYTDYWGNTVTAFGLHEPHTELTVRGSSVVRTPSPAGPGPDPVDWAALGRDPVLDDLAEFLQPTKATAADERLAAAAVDVRAARDPVSAVRAAVADVRARLAYRPGATSVRTSAADAAAAGAGVCQDFVHVTLAVLRAAGVPARYCSGYLLPAEDPETGRVLTGDSHAWVEAWTGRWWGTDPTNSLDTGPRHVLVARGRDYADVAPLRGVYCGDGTQRLDVTVTMTRLPD